jgi:ADP-ribose pyrophosphatase YjhB (NUDIX family)
VKSPHPPMLRRPAVEGEEFAVHSNGGDWLVAWHSPIAVPEGRPHGANAFCVTADKHVVLISNDGARWGWPGGRPEGDESWEETLRREILEEACAVVGDALLLGFCRSECVSGPEKSLVLVRSVWRADGELLPWEPKFEIRHRSLVPAPELLGHLTIEEGFEPIYHRALIEAGFLTESPGGLAG